MLSAAPIRAYIPVANLQCARKFYEETVEIGRASCRERV